MMKFMTRVKNMIEKQIFVLSEQTKNIKQTTPIKMRKNPSNGTGSAISICKNGVQADMNYQSQH